MKTAEIIELDYRVVENRNTIQKVLKKIKPLSKYSEEENVPIDMLEMLLYKLCSKYAVHINITQDPVSGDTNIWKCTIINDKTLYMFYVFGMCMYEVLAKVCIGIYSGVKSERFVER